MPLLCDATVYPETPTLALTPVQRHLLPICKLKPSAPPTTAYTSLQTSVLRCILLMQTQLLMLLLCYVSVIIKCPALWPGTHCTQCAQLHLAALSCTPCSHTHGTQRTHSSHFKTSPLPQFSYSASALAIGLDKSSLFCFPSPADAITLAWNLILQRSTSSQALQSSPTAWLFTYMDRY